MTILSLLLLVSLLPHLTFTARVNVGIVNGTEAEPHSRPYMVSLQKHKKHICGGFLISDEFVLTAAHCQRHSTKLTVVVGAHNLKNKKERAERIKVKSYHKHPGSCSGSVFNDIMLLRLKRTVQGMKNVNTISIPTQEGDIEADSVCSVAGWGRLKTKGKKTDYLMEANVYIMDNKDCETSWKEWYSVSQMMCTHGYSGSCNGDSGGPLVCGDTAVAVTSFGDPVLCNSPKKPNAYTKISAYLHWIRKTINNVN